MENTNVSCGLKGIEFFAGKQLLTETFINNNVSCQSLDFIQIRKSRKLDFQIDFLDFDYQAHYPGFFDFLYFGLPCTTFSKASGGKHFKNGIEPLTDMALTSIKMIDRMFEIIEYLKPKVFYIENPSGGLCNNHYFNIHFKQYQAYIYRLSLGAFGFATQKMTDIFTNSQIPILHSPVTRQNGRYSKVKFDNLTLRQRQSYPLPFCEMIVENCLLNFNH
jgi:hypothetical protein